MELSHSRTRVTVCSFVGACSSGARDPVRTLESVLRRLLFSWLGGAVSLLLVPRLLFFIFHSLGFPFPVNSCFSHRSARPFSLG